MLGTTAHEPISWPIAIKAESDVIELSTTSAKMLESEDLDALICREVVPNEHLGRVIKEPISIKNISLAHSTRRVEPVLRQHMEPIHELLAVPPPLTDAVVSTFKKWYHNRAVYNTGNQKKQEEMQWKTFEGMLGANKRKRELEKFGLPRAKLHHVRT